EAAAGYPSVAARHAAMTSAAQDSRMLAAALDELATALDARERACTLATREAQAGGFDSLELARSAVLRPAEQSAMSDQVSSWTRKLAALRAAAAAPEFGGLDPAMADVVRADAERAATELARARDAEQEAKTGHETLRARSDRLSG